MRRTSPHAEPTTEDWAALRARLGGPPAPGVGPERLLAAARAADVVPLLAELDPEVAELAREDLRRAMFRHLHVERATRRIADVLTRAGVHATALLKGNATAHLVYERPSLRMPGDVDVLVAPRAFRTAVHALRADGWVDDVPALFPRVQGADPFEWPMARDVGPIRIDCDLHQRLVPGRHVRVEDEGVLSRARSREGVAMPLCHPEDALLHACLHAAKDNYRVVLKSWVDVARLVEHPDVDLGRCVERARRWRIRTATWAGLRIARRWLSAPVDEEVLAALEPPTPRKVLLRQILSGDGMHPLRLPLGRRAARYLLGPLACDDGGARRRWVADMGGRWVRRLRREEPPRP